MFGWTGRTVIVDLGNNSVTELKTEKSEVDSFIGGRGMGARWLSKLADPTVDPLSPENILIFSTGPLTGSSAPMSGHFGISTISPLTGTIFDTNVGGFFGAELKLAGFDSLIITGKAEEPVIIQIYDEEVEILPADYLWGKNSAETTTLLEAKGNVLCIGRAGEKMIPMASMINDHIYSSGRGGHGAVAGSKNLKALVVKGTNKIEIADSEAFDRTVDKINKMLVANPPASKGLAEYGTPVFVNLLSHMGILPGNNFRKRNFDAADRLSGESIKKNYDVQQTPCQACSIGCKRAFMDGKAVPEYDAIWAFGPNIVNDDLDLVTSLNDICQDYGMDPISCGAAIAAYMEVNSPDMESIDPQKLLKDIAEGNSELSRGTKAYLCSKQAESSSMTVKGLDIPGYDPREMLGMALAYATSNRGACHLSAFMAGPELIGKPVLLNRQSFAGKAALVQHFQNLAALIDSLILCPFISLAIGEVELAALITAVTGVNYSSEELLRCGERIYNLERAFNIKAGFSKEEDMLPERFFAEDGLERTEFEKSMLDYYHFRGWDNNGNPTDKKLQELGLEIN
ncbi:aldehyde ferredoxin oxidoreductase family protein [Methanolobus sp. ZRKC3]|uniref:aldehyde ferredoxin oxidoreductase family protein n=1 Tax=Methanolobus sp. ZRKC3 TaxID=3125786 RepID=UPI00324DB61D